MGFYTPKEWLFLRLNFNKTIFIGSNLGICPCKSELNAVNGKRLERIKNISFLITNQCSQQTETSQMIIVGFLVVKS